MTAIARRPSPASQRCRSSTWAVRTGSPRPVRSLDAPSTSSSGKCTSPMPRSARGSTAHRSATCRVAASSRRAARSSEPSGRGDLLGHLVHLLAGLEVALGVDPVDVPDVERDQPAGGVEHVGGRGVGPVGVAHRVGEHRGEPLLDARGRASGRPAAGRRGPRWRDHLEQQVGGVDHLPPAGQDGAGQVGAADGERPADLGAGAEQHQQAATGGGRGPDVLGDQVDGAHRLPALAAQVGGRHQPAQRRPAGRSRASRVTRGCRGSTAAPPLAGCCRPAAPAAGGPQRRVDHRRRGEQPGGLDREVDAEDRPDPGRAGRPGRTSPRRRRRRGR